jgi:hypothetical protein
MPDENGEVLKAIRSAAWRIAKAEPHWLVHQRHVAAILDAAPRGAWRIARGTHAPSR